MKLRRDVIWLVTALFAVCLAGMIHLQEQGIVLGQTPAEQVTSSLVTSRQQLPHEAVLTDAANLYRICSSRSRRVVPTQGSRSKRTPTPGFSFVGQHVVKPLFSPHDGRCHLASAPLCLSASRDYYVIALRHILR